MKYLITQYHILFLNAYVDRWGRVPEKESVKSRDGSVDVRDESVKAIDKIPLSYYNDIQCGDDIT